MYRFGLVLLLAINNNLAVASIYPGSTLSINSGEGFVFHLNLPPSFEISECRLVIVNAGVEFQLSSESASHLTYNNELIEFAHDCGARVKNVSTLSQDTWRLQAVPKDTTMEMETGNLRLEILKSIQETTIFNESGIAGHFGTIHCPGEYSEQRHCEITDPLNKVTESCEITVKYPPLDELDPQVYRCKVFFWGRLDAVHTETHVRSIESALKVNSKIEENDRQVILSCKLDESFSVCRAESLSTGNQYLLMDGFQSRRYSAWNTLLENGLCQIEIPKPLAVNETGVWRIHGKLKGSSGVWTGCLFNLHATMSSEVESFEAQLENIVHLETAADSIDIRCADSPYPLDYCYLETPTHEVIRPSIREMHLFKQYGRCTFAGVKAVSGRYTCGFPAIDHSRDLFQHFDVKYNDPMILADVQAEIVHVGPSNRFSLMCFALLDHSIDSCVFVSPIGELYHLPNSSYANQRFGYYGRGFVEGECGIEIYRVEEGHSGNWTCSINLVDKLSHINLHILVKSNSKKFYLFVSLIVFNRIKINLIAALSVASVVGIALGAVVILGLLLGFLLYQRRKRNNATEETAAAQNGSGELLEM